MSNNSTTNNRIRLIFILAILIIVLFTSIVVFASKIFIIIGDDGFAVPALSGILEGLMAESGDPVSLVEVTYDEVVYKRLLGYFVGEGRTQIDITFPLYVNGGAGLRFLDQENWLITSDVDIYQTYDGLYVNDGISYNIDMSQADEDRFIFLMLPNNLFMNVQHAVFENRLGKQEIPLNSILSMKETSITWYAYHNGVLEMHHEGSVFDATMTIDGVTYNYRDLLLALGLARDAIEQSDNNRPAPEILEEAEEILLPNQKNEEEDEGRQNKNNGLEEDPLGGTGANTEDSDNAGNATGGDDGGSDAGGTGGSSGDSGSGDGSGGDGGSSGDSGSGGGESGGSGSGGSNDNDGAAGSTGTPPDGGTDGDSNNTGSTGTGGNEDGEFAPARVTFTAQKLLDGLATPDDVKFNFVLKDRNGTVLETVQNDGPAVNFTSLFISEAGTYTYTVEEVKGDASDMRYDDTVYTIIVVITKGTTSFESTMTIYKAGAEYESTMLFENEHILPPPGPADPDPGTPGTGTDPVPPGDTPPSGDGDGEGGDGDGDSEGDGSSDEEGEPGEDGDEKPGEGTSGTTRLTFKYPVVTIKNLNPWCYALDMDLEVKDPSASIRRGVKLALYSSIKGSGDPTVDENGRNVYDADDYKGQSLVLRKTRTGTQELALSPLKPGQTVYLQYTYNYNEAIQDTDEQGNLLFDEKGNPIYKTVKSTVKRPVIDPETGEQSKDPVTGKLLYTEEEIDVLDTVRKTVYSDFVEIKIPMATDAGVDVQPVALNWNTEFAASHDSISLTHLTMANTSAYDPEKAEAGYDFENFKLNTLPYVYRMELTLTPTDGGDPIVLTVSNSILNRAQTMETVFQSMSPKLDSNTEYRVTAKLKDRYGNDIPMVIGPEGDREDYTTYEELMYTRKQQPSVTITEVENITDSLTLTLTVSDPDGALAGESLHFTMRAGNADAILYGTWVNDGSGGTGRFGNDSTTMVELKNPTDKKSYTLKLESLAFAQKFKAQVHGDYLPQPDATDTPALDRVNEALLGSTDIYTASLSDGLISFITSFNSITHRSAILNLTMDSNTTIDILPLVDEFRVYLLDPQGNVVTSKDSQGNVLHSKTVLNQETLDVQDSTAYPYDDTRSGILLDAGSQSRPELLLYGTSEQAQATPWQSFCISQIAGTNPDTGESTLTYTRPMQLQVKLPTDKDAPDYLKNNTRYTMVVEAVVIKGGREYLIPVTITNNQFTTKKTAPEILYDDLFIASDGATFVDLKIWDPDSTIENGKVTVELRYGRATMDIYGRVTHGTLLQRQEIIADQSADGSGGVQDVAFTGLVQGAEYYIRFVADGYQDEESYSSRQAGYDLIPYDYLKISGGSSLVGNLSLSKLVRNAGDAANLANSSTKYEKTVLSVDYDRFEPRDRYVSYVMPCSPKTTYTISFTNIDSDRYVYWGSVNSTAQAIAAAAEGGATVSSGTNSYSSRKNQHVIVDFTTGANDNFFIISCGISAATVEKFEETLVVQQKYIATPVGSYNATIQVDVQDDKGYLGQPDGGAKVTLSLYRSDSMEMPDFQPYKPDGENAYVVDLPLTAITGTNGFTLDLAHIVSSLTPNSAWQAVLSCEYQGRPIDLDSITFRTDGDYSSASTHKELYDAVQRNPYGNILVTSDFEMDPNVSQISVSGTIDFQGHVVTRGTNTTKRLFYDINSTGTVKNLVYRFPAELSYTNTADMVYNLYGTLENLMVETQGNVIFNYDRELIQTIQQNGVLRNFIFKIGGQSGNVVLHNDNSDGSLGLIAGQVNGTVENGYIYAASGTQGILQTGERNSAIMGYQYGQSKVRHVYVLADNWQRVDASNQPLNSLLLGYAGGTSYRGNFTGVYTVGDFYAIGADYTNKNYMLPLTTAKILPSSSSSVNLYNFTKDPTITLTGGNKADMQLLYDAQWQSMVLGDAFDVENCISMNFYPRLNLPAVMQKHQEYLDLPVRDEDTKPTILSDGWADPEVYKEPTLNSGYIVLRMRNVNNYRITGLTIDNLKMVGEGEEAIVSQTPTADGFYDVVVHVAVDPDNPAYLSSYNISTITYRMNNQDTQLLVNYTTTGIEFWKEVSNAAQWADINGNMAWNYKVTQDINFLQQGAKPGEMTINGSSTSLESKTVFNGKIDGGEHVLTGIQVEGKNNPSVIYSLGGTGEVRNLFIEDMVLSCSERATPDYVGFIRYVGSGAQVRNVRIRNSQVTAAGRMGMLIGSCQENLTVIEGCSAVDSLLQDIDTSTAIYAGGLIGSGGSKVLTQGCYTRNMTIDITRAPNISGVGGLMGYHPSANIQDCYTHGTIRSTGSFVGGIYGTKSGGDGTWMGNVISYVNILQTSGNHAGGLTGGLSGTTVQSVALGDVSGAGSQTSRIGDGGTKRLCYAWSGQKVGTLTDTDKGDATGLLTGEELGRRSTWQDVVTLGTSWDYAPVDQGFMPQLIADYDCSREGWQQVGIPLPGQSGDPSLTLQEALYNSQNTMNYYLRVRLDHPKSTKVEMEQYFADKNNMILTLDGMDIGDAAQAGGSAEVLHTSHGDVAGEGCYTIITISTKTHQLALDSYLLTIRYNDGRDRELSTMVTYKAGDGTDHIPWLRISNISEWNAAMPQHGQTDENIMITGVVDFGNANTDYRSLRFNRLVGESEGNGFKNLAYNGGEMGECWVDKVGKDLSNLTFDACTFDYTRAQLSRSATGAFLSVYDVTNLKLKNITLNCNYYTAAYFGFLSRHGGTLQNIEIDTITMTRGAGISDGRSYAGSLVAFSNGSISDIRAKNVKVNMPGNSYVGGILGVYNLYSMSVSGFTVEGLSVKGTSYVGGVAGNINSGPGKVVITGKAEDDMNVVYASSTGAGGVVGYQSSYTGCDLTITGMNISATSRAGGAYGVVAHNTVNKALIQNCTIEARTSHYAGGVAGEQTWGQSYIYDTQILGCDIKATGDYVGGIQGYCTPAQQSHVGLVVRATTISGANRVGGYMGYCHSASSTSCSMQRVYIAEDTTVTGTGDYVGGLVGRISRLTMKDSINGAQVSGVNCVGGAVGSVLIPDTGDLQVTLTRIVSMGNVSASGDYAGGLIGKLESQTVKYSNSTLVNCLVSASVVSGDSNASFWINDTSPSGSAGEGSVYVNEDSLLNGQRARALHEANLALDQNIFVVPGTGNVSGQYLVTGETFNTKAFYQTTLAFDTQYWDYSHVGSSGNIYMPYTKSRVVSNASSVLKYANHDAAENPDGIPVPEASTQTGELVVYASGVNTINIEVPVPAGATEGVSLTVAGLTDPITTNADGVITLYHNFGSDVTVTVNGGTPATFQASDMTRKVMTYGDYWYYIRGGKVYYGRATGTLSEEEEPIAGITDALHLWRGKLLTQSGKIYTLTGGTASEESTAANNNLTTAVTTPLWTSGDATAYHNFTKLKNTRMDYQIFMMDGVPYTVSPGQNMVYDGVVLSMVGSGATAQRYFATLGEDGSLKAWASDMLMGGAPNRNIDHISNNFGYTGTVLLFYYTDGNVVGINYATGTQLFSTIPQNFTTYVMSNLSSIFSASPASEDSDILRGDPFYQESQAIQNEKEPILTEIKKEESTEDTEDTELTVEPGAPGITPDTPGSAAGTTGGVVAEPGGGQYQPGGIYGAGTGGDSLPGTEVPDITQNAGEIPEDGAVPVTPGTNPVAGSVTQPVLDTSQQPGDSGLITGNADPQGNANPNGSNETLGTNSVNGTNGDSTAADPEGETSGGETPADSAESTPDSSGGTSGGNSGSSGGESSGSSGGESSGSSGGNGGESQSGSGSSETSSSVEDAAAVSESEMLQELLGVSLMVYSPEAGGYVAMDTESLASGAPVTLEDAIAYDEAEKNPDTDTSDDSPAEAEQPVSLRELILGRGISRSLYQVEKQGFLMIGVAACTAAVILAVIYFIVIRKRRK